MGHGCSNLLLLQQHVGLVLEVSNALRSLFFGRSSFMQFSLFSLFCLFFLSCLMLIIINEQGTITKQKKSHSTQVAHKAHRYIACFAWYVLLVTFSSQEFLMGATGSNIMLVLSRTILTSLLDFFICELTKQFQGSRGASWKKYLNEILLPRLWSLVTLTFVISSTSEIMQKAMLG